MKRPPEHVLEERSRRKLKSSLPDQWIIRDITPDYGLDMEITIAENGEVTTEVIAIQVKATEEVKDTRKGLTCPLETKHLKYYENYPLPVFIFCYVKAESSFHYLFAQKYIKENLSRSCPNWRKKVKIPIPFSPDCELSNIDTLRSRITESIFYVKRLSANTDPSKAVYTLDGIPKSDDKELKKRFLRALTFVEMYKFREAVDEFDNILKVCTISPIEKMVILNGLGGAQLALCDFDAALKSYEAIITLTRKVNKSETQEGLAVAWGNLAIIYKTRGELTKALKYSKLSLNLQKVLGNREAESNILNNIAIIYRTRGWVNKAMEYSDAALNINREIGNRKGEANVLSNMGNIYQMKGDSGKALKTYRLSLRVDKEIGNRYGEANNLGSIGLVWGKRGKLDKAMEYFQQALEMHREIGNREGEATSLCNLGNLYYQKRYSWSVKIQSISFEYI